MSHDAQCLSRFGTPLLTHVILNGGEAAVRDRTRAGTSMLWVGMLTLHAAFTVLATALPLLCASCGPSEGYCPPQDDYFVEIPRFRMTVCFRDHCSLIWSLFRVAAATLLSGCHSAGLVWIRRGPDADTFRRRGNRVCRFCSNQRFLPATRSAWCYSSRP
jgi:hypothetical protein